jgi:hypothetical protein
LHSRVHIFIVAYVVLPFLLSLLQLMDLLFSFVKPDHPHNTLLSGYFSKVTSYLYLNHPFTEIGVSYPYQTLWFRCWLRFVVFVQSMYLIHLIIILQVVICLMLRKTAQLMSYVQVFLSSPLWIRDTLFIAIKKYAKPIVNLTFVVWLAIAIEYCTSASFVLYYFLSNSYCIKVLSCLQWDKLVICWLSWLFYGTIIFYRSIQR